MSLVPFESISMKPTPTPSLDLDPSKNKVQEDKSNLKFVLTLYTLWTISPVNGTTMQLLIFDNLSTSLVAEESADKLPKKESKV